MTSTSSNLLRFQQGAQPNSAPNTGWNRTVGFLGCLFLKTERLEMLSRELWVWLKKIQSYLILGVFSGMERYLNLIRQYISTNATSIMSLFMFDRLKTIKTQDVHESLANHDGDGFSRVFNWWFLGQFQRFRGWIAIFHQWHNCSDCLWILDFVHQSNIDFDAFHWDGVSIGLVCLS